ncbi:MAG TPA: 1,6-dihydroxycyclohexa-2,4-diene-1-carboxylate dehydrogenase [Rhodospirillaceae bacterium]|nr:1,6-dihydroxycyclohexa-2,4-diene-1-carboxylate dehydrogenase [Rhodospirillaceae bacterium]|tara:strand:+ start:273 stop:1058 length:786 start_codon:yes stop_codon:yes gene_type:complete
MQDKVCVITGAGQGIGRATARRLGQEGGKIVVADRIDETATRTTDELLEHGVEAVKSIVDLSTYEGSETLMAEASAAFGRIDVLVNNVGGTIWMKPFHLYTEKEVEMELERSLMPTLWGCRAVLPIMMEQKSGSIVNLGSQSVRGLYRLPYASSKGGILALGKVLAMEYGKHGIRVNTVSPGGTEIPDRVTQRNYVRPGVIAEDPENADEFRREMIEDITNQQAIRRRGTPEEQAAAVAFLASDDASFITGDNINCSGGQS